MTTSDPKEIPRLYGALNERILAKDKEGTIEIYYELLRLGQPLAQLMAGTERAEDGPEPRASSLADEASAAGAEADILDEPPTPGSPRPAPARLAERASGTIAEHRDWAIDDAAPGNALPIAGDTGNQLPLSGPANITPDAQPESHPVARARLSPIVRYGLAAGAIVAVAGAGVLLLHPAAQKITPGGPPASETAVSSRVGTSPTADAAATPPAPAAAASDTATRGAPTAEPEPAPAVSTVTAPPSAEPAPEAQPVPEAPEREGVAAVEAPAPAAAPAEPAPGAQPVPEAPEREGVAAVEAPAPAAAPAEPVPTALPAPASPTPKAPSGMAASTSKAPPDQRRPASTEIAALLARGDSLLGVGDIASARLFYERASDAGNGRAAMRLGATYDPGFLDQVHLPNMNGDVAKALSWYRRARDLGESEAERWIQALESKSGR